MKTYKIKDKTESYKIQKGNDLFNLPMKLLITGKSELSGKSSVLLNLMLLYYRDDFKPENIYLISPSAYTDNKMKILRKELKIPNENVMDEFKEEKMEVLYDFLQDEYNDAVDDGKKPAHSIIIFDDCAVEMRNSKMLDKMFYNARHFLVSIVCLSQSYIMNSTKQRSQMTGGIFFDLPARQIEHIYNDHSNIDKKSFFKMFRDATKEKHSFFIINYSNNPEFRYGKKGN